MNSIPLLDRCRGRWRSILPMMGIGAQFLTGKNGPCPMCGGKDRWRFTDHKQNGWWVCNTCGKGNGIELVMEFKGSIEFKSAAQMIEGVIGKSEVVTNVERSPAELRQAMTELWGQGVAVTSESLSGRYLESRGVFHRCSSLRDVASMRCTGLLAKIVGPEGKAAVNVQRIYLDENAMKITRKVMPGTVPPGSAVRLFPIGPVLGIAEGIETALSASKIFGIPVWAALNAGNLEGFRPPDGVTEVVICADHDANFVGQASAHIVARDILRWADQRKLDISVRIELPEMAGDDWNDVWLRNGDKTPPNARQNGHEVIYGYSKTPETA